MIAKRPPLPLTFLAVLLLALGTTGGAAMSLLGPRIRSFSVARVVAAPEAHGLSGSPEYDADVVDQIVFTLEAALSFFHTHAEGMGLVLFFGATAVASLVRPSRLRRLLWWLLGLSFVFPVGWLVHAGLLLLLDRDRARGLAEQLVLIPFGSLSILGGVLLAGALGRLAARGGRARAAPSPRPGAAPDAGPRADAARAAGWPRPPAPVVLAAALLLVLAELGGAAMGRFKAEIDAFVVARAAERPDVHGLVGVRDVDGEILDELRVKHDSGLRLFHLHAEGLALIVLAGALVTASLTVAPGLRRALYALLTLGGAGFPAGYLVWSALAPFAGTAAARTTAATAVLAPLGGLLLVALWALTALLARDLVARARSVPAGRDVPAAPGRTGAMRLPPLGVVLAAVLLLVLAEMGGSGMVAFKVNLDRARRAEVEARPRVHGLVGVRALDGPVVDEVLSRADFAFRLFHLHGEGMALVVFAGGLMIRNFVRSRRAAAVLHTLLALGGFAYPFGYLAWGLLMPRLGLGPARTLVETFVWAPFGGLALAALALFALALGSRLFAAPGGAGGP